MEVRAGQEYRRLGPSCYQVSPDDPQTYRILLQEAFDKNVGARAVVHLWSLDTVAAEQLTPQQLEQDLTLSCRSVLHLTQALLQSGWRAMPRLVLVTRNSQAVTAEDTVAGLSQSALWGLGQSIVLEHPALSCTRVDLGTGDSAELGSLLQELQVARSASQEEQVALRGANRYVARLVRGAFRRRVSLQTAVCQSDASYLISGGLSGLGLATAEWLVTQGAKYLILLARSKPSEVAAAVIKRLRDNGVRVLAAAVDVAQHQAVNLLMDELWNPQAAEMWPPLRGVVHSAAILDDGVLLEQSWERFQRVMSPKLIGAFNLHLVTKRLPLDFFVSYSSVASLLGSPGQSNYVAANAFVDALAHHQQGSGRQGLSVNWGPFSDIAIAFNRPEISKRLAASGMATMTPAEGLAMLEPLLRGGNPQTGVTDLDVSKWAATFPSLNESSYWRELLAGSGHVSRPRLASSQAWRSTLLGLPALERRPLLAARLVDHMSQILRLQASRVDRESPFMLLGMDSLMALQLRNLIDLDVEVTVPIAFLLKEASIDRLSDYLLEHLPDAEMTAAGPVHIEEGEV